MASNVNHRPYRIGIVAGENSGDALAADLIHAFKRQYPQMIFEGIAGPKMIAAGCRALIPMEQISVIGLLEVLKHIPQILKARKDIKKYFLKHPPDLFIGVDAPDFNLDLELALKKSGIRTAHYVSPSVWAWRQERVHKIARATDLMLTLFPFEAPFYERHQIPVCFVGHPLADEVPLVLDQAEMRRQFGLPQDKTIIALLPGSRSVELKMLGDLFIQTAAACLKARPNIEFVAPMVNQKIYKDFESRIAASRVDLPIRLFEGHARELMAASDAVLLASGTATLEGMLVKKPMVVAYRMSSITYHILKKLVKVKHISLPNLLADQPLVPEHIQEAATPAALSAALLEQLDDFDKKNLKIFDELHRTLKRQASERAVEALSGLFAI